MTTQHVLRIIKSIWWCATGAGTRCDERKSASTTARSKWQWASSDTSCANDDDVRIKGFIMIASAGVHARDFLLRTHKPSILSHITPTRCTHRRSRILIPVPACEESWHWRGSG